MDSISKVNVGNADEVQRNLKLAETKKLGVDMSSKISDIVVSPTVVIDLTESLEIANSVKNNNDTRIAMKFYNGYDTWNPFSKKDDKRGVNQGVFRKLLSEFKKEFAILDESRVVFVSSSSTDDSLKLHAVFTNWLEQTLRNVWSSSITKDKVDSLESGTGVEVDYQAFESGMGVESYLSLIEQNTVDDTGSTSIVNTAAIRFKMAVPMLCRVKEPESFLTSIINFLSRNSTDRIPLSLGLLLSPKLFETQLGLEIVQYCENMVYISKDSYIDTMGGNNHTEDQACGSNLQAELIDFPILTSVDSVKDVVEYADWLYGDRRNNMMYLLKIEPHSKDTVIS